MRSINKLPSSSAWHLGANSGVSMIELVVALAIAALLAAIALPSYTGLVNGDRISTQANDLVTAIQLARSEAVRRNSRVLVCGSSNGTSCNDSTWSRWVVGVDADRNGAIDANGVVRTDIVKNNLTLTNSAALGTGVISFRPTGFASAADGSLLNGGLSVCVAASKPVNNIRTVFIAAGSRVSVVQSSGGGACNSVPADSP